MPLEMRGSSTAPCCHGQCHSHKVTLAHSLQGFHPEAHINVQEFTHTQFLLEIYGNTSSLSHNSPNLILQTWLCRKDQEV